MRCRVCSGLQALVMKFELAGRTLQIEGLLDDFNHETADYMQDFSFDANEFSELEKKTRYDSQFAGEIRKYL